MACKPESAVVPGRKTLHVNLQKSSAPDPGTVAVSVMATELDHAITRALSKLEKAGISEQMAWDALHQAIGALQECFVAVEDEGDARKPLQLRPHKKALAV